MSEGQGGSHFSVLAMPRDAVALHAAIDAFDAQDFQDFDAIFLDVGTVDELAMTVARELRRASVLPVERGMTLADALNRAASAARGRYLAFLESGDGWHPRYLSYQNAVFDAVPDALYSRAGYGTRDLRGDGFLPAGREAAAAPDAALELLACADLPTLSCFSVSRSLFLRSGGFDPRSGSLLRTDLEIRLLGGLRSGGRLACEEHPAPQIPQVLVLRRLGREVEDLADALAAWSHDLNPFLDGLFERPFMARFRDHRDWFEARLIERHCDALRAIEASLPVAA